MASISSREAGRVAIQGMAVVLVVWGGHESCAEHQTKPSRTGAPPSKRQHKYPIRTLANKVQPHRCSAVDVRDCAIASTRLWRPRGRACNFASPGVLCEISFSRSCGARSKRVLGGLPGTIARSSQSLPAGGRGEPNMTKPPFANQKVSADWGNSLPDRDFASGRGADPRANPDRLPPSDNSLAAGAMDTRDHDDADDSAALRPAVTVGT